MGNESTRKAAAREARERLARKQRRNIALLVSAGAAAVLGLVAVIGYGIYVLQRPDAGAATPRHATADRTGVTVGTGPVQVEVYLDYLCPACKVFEKSAESTLRQYVDDGRITIVYHPVAILDRLSTNRYSSRAAAGAGCASDVDKMFEYTAALYDDQPAEGGAGHTDDELIEIAAAAGLPRETFGSCLKDSRYSDWVSTVTDSTVDRRVTGTPTVFVNGKQLARNSVDELKAAVDAA